jgi:hypothetical protein
MPCAAVRVTKGQTDTFVTLSSDVCFLSHNKSLVSISYSTAELLAASEFAVASSQPPISSCRLAYMRVKGKNQTENRIKIVRNISTQKRHKSGKKRIQKQTSAFGKCPLFFLSQWAACAKSGNRTQKKADNQFCAAFCAAFRMSTFFVYIHCKKLRHPIRQRRPP